MHPVSQRVVVAMSGGVDSSVAAALLVEGGFEVVGMMLRLWSEEGQELANRCCSPESMALARQVAGQLDIPFYVLDVRLPFKDLVVQYFIDGYAGGLTPNPCLVCNREIRWGLLREQALALGAAYLATGHYARLDRQSSGNIQLLKGRDSAKDQSYVLSVLNQTQLSQTLFPVGEFTKAVIRGKAAEFGLLAAGKADSQDLCFITGGDYRDFLARHAPGSARPGFIMDTEGRVIGEHTGLANYTIGQRKGLGVSSPGPLYVREKIVESNLLVVGERRELGRNVLVAERFNWISGQPPAGPFHARVKIRYRARENEALVIPDSAGTKDVRIEFDEPLFDITPGQLAAVYHNEVCLGGGLIKPFRNEGGL